jgi:hypothetical protein
VNTLAWRALIVGLALSSTGCSFLFVRPTPANVHRLPPSEPVACTSGVAAPVLDTVFGTYEVFRTVYALSRTDGDYRGQVLSRDVDVGSGVALTVLLASSAIYGYATTSKCADAKERHALARARFQREPAGGGAGVPRRRKRPPHARMPAAGAPDVPFGAAGPAAPAPSAAPGPDPDTPPPAATPPPNPAPSASAPAPPTTEPAPGSTVPSGALSPIPF